MLRSPWLWFLALLLALGVWVAVRVVTDPGGDAVRVDPPSGPVRENREREGGAPPPQIRPIAPDPEVEARRVLASRRLVDDVRGALTATPRDVGGRVETSDGEPLAGARVTLLDDGSPVLTRSYAGERLAEAETDARGRFVLPRALRPTERALLHVHHDDFAWQWVRPVDALLPATLDRTIRLSRGGELQGTVASATGDALVATVVVFDLGAPVDGRSPWVEAEATVKSDGTFALARLSAGPKRVVFRAPGHAAAVREPVMITEGSSSQTGATLAAGGAVRGVVRDGATGRPLENATVEARMVPSTTRRAPSPTLEARTDVSGRFELVGLPVTLHVLSATAPGFRAAPLRNVLPDSGKEETFLLERLGVLAGVVRGTATGHAIPHFSITLSRGPRRVPLGTSDRRRFADEGGRFEVDGVPPGRHFLIVEAPGCVTKTLGPYTVGLGERIDGLDVELDPGGVLLGRVVGPAGGPVADATVTLLGEVSPTKLSELPIPEHPNRTAVRVAMGDTKTLEDGSFLLAKVPPGTFHVVVRHAALAPAASEPVVVNGPDTVTLPDLFLRSAAGIEGRVLDARGQRDPRAVVRITPLRGSLAQPARQASTNTDGFFRVQGLIPGAYRIAVLPRIPGRTLPADAGDLTTLVSGETKTVELRRE